MGAHRHHFVLFEYFKGTIINHYRFNLKADMDKFIDQRLKDGARVSFTMLKIK